MKPLRAVDPTVSGVARILAVTLLGAALLSCSGASTDPSGSLTGNWSGRSGLTSLSVSLVDNAGQLSGRGDFDSGTGSVACVNAAVTGTSTGGVLSITISGASSGSLAVCDVSFSGGVNGSSASGTVAWNDGSTGITLTRS